MRAVLPLLCLAACASRPPAPAAPPAAAPPPDGEPRLLVELRVARSHERALHDGASAGLATIPFVVPLSRGPGGPRDPRDPNGDVELQLDVARLDAVNGETVCTIKILALRLPEQDLFGMAEGSARASGTHAQAATDCLERLGASLVGGQVRAILHKRLDEKR